MKKDEEDQPQEQQQDQPQVAQEPSGDAVEGGTSHNPPSSEDDEAGNVGPGDQPVDPNAADAPAAPGEGQGPGLGQGGRSGQSSQ